MADSAPASKRSPNQSATSRFVWQWPEGADGLVFPSIVFQILEPGEPLAELPSGTGTAVKDYRAWERGDALFDVWRLTFSVQPSASAFSV